MNDTKSQGTPAVGFLVMAFTDEKAGDEALKAMKAAKQQKQFYFENAAVIRQDAAGKVHYHETGDMKSGKGAGVGALIGGVVGIFGGPAGVALGAGAGAAVGAAVAHKDEGFRDESLKFVGKAMKPGTSAVAAITSVAFLKEVQKQVKEEDVHPFVDKLAAKVSDRLNEGKNVALGILLSEAGLVYKEVAADEKSTEVIGAAITDESVVAGIAVYTENKVEYGVVAATSDMVATEVGTASKDGAVVVDDIVTSEGEVVIARAALPEATAQKKLEEPTPAAPVVKESKPVEPAPKPVETKAPVKTAAKPAAKKPVAKAAPAKKPVKKAVKKAAPVKKTAPKKPAKAAPKKPAKKSAPVKKAASKKPAKKTAKPAKKSASAKKSSKKK
jgi:uncharacterized membrane protein